MSGGALFAADALLPTGWARDVLIEWNTDGTLTGVRPHSGQGHTSGAPRAGGPVLPGTANLHSHAFQRAFAGLAEVRAAGDDSFWTWRERMYQVAGAITPETLEAIATWLFVEMLEGGFTSVCEFHYLHHDERGRPYADPDTLAHCIARAATRAGIGLTLLPVFYAHGNFGAAAPSPRQARFLTTLDSYGALLDGCRAAIAPLEDARLGVAPHSLRAATLEEVRAVAGLADGGPVHIHAAEQTREVEDSIAQFGAPPVEVLLDRIGLGERWCLIHATHLTGSETRRLAASGAVAGLCPVT